MRKLFSLALFITLALSTVAPLTEVRAATNVIGQITSNTTWTHSGSPYRLTGPVQIVSGVTLTIDSGVTVDFAGYIMLVNGVLNAQGTPSSPILFLDSRNTQSSEYYVQFVASNSNHGTVPHESIVENAVFNSTGVAVQGCSPKLSHNTFNQSSIRVSDSSATISNNYFKHGSITAGGNSSIINNIIENGFDGIRLYGQAICEANTVTDCLEVGIAGSEDTVTIKQNYVTNNRWIGISGTGHIEANTIVNNKVGIQLGNSVNPTIKNNNIYGNTENNIVIKDSTNIDASDNYWGTTEGSAIEQKILDSKDDFNLGTVTYQPFLRQPSHHNHLFLMLQIQLE